MKTIDTAAVAELIDFAPTEQTKRMGFAEAQLLGTAATYNMLARNRLAYIADEVGMGKTYIALGVMGLLRFFKPDARIMVIAPRENIQQKWEKELGNFTRFNWRIEDNRVKDLHGGPVRRPVRCGRTDDIVRTLLVDDHRDLFLRATTFQASVKEGEGRTRCRQRILPYVPWISRSLLPARGDDLSFRDMYGRILNAVIPDVDLLVIDEAHNFKHGFRRNGSNRNRILGMALGHPKEGHDDCEWYAPRVKRVLMLSATPFEYDYADLHGQLDVFGFGDHRITDAEGANAKSLRALKTDDDELKRELVSRFLIRRVSYLNVGQERLSKNLYRREWRLGGYEAHDKPMSLGDAKQRLIVGLIQKKVSEILGDERFKNSFQIGMLSSFESFMESMSRRRALPSTADASEEADEEAGVFDGSEQTRDSAERQGIDSHSLEKVVGSYRKRFGRGLPHPKLDATADALKDAFDTGDKALVFVRRVATTGELKSKLDAHYDTWLRRKMEAELPPSMHGDLDKIFAQYREETRSQTSARHGHSNGRDDEDEGGTDSFFAWFFRGTGPGGILSGAAFQKNRLRSLSSAYSTLFEDDYVSWLLDHPDDPMSELAAATGRPPSELGVALRQLAWNHFRHRSQQEKGYPRVIVFESYQSAALQLLAERADETGTRAQVVLNERFEQAGIAADPVPTGFPKAEDSIGAATFFTELIKHPDLRDAIWPEDSTGSFAEMFRRREQRRELLSAMTRLGASYVDLYLLALAELGSFDLRTESRIERPEISLLARFITRLEEQQKRPHEMHAFRELSQAAEAFDVIHAVNFPEVRDARLSEIATIYGRTLQNQDPVARMHGGVAKRMVRQFRMPGYPLVLVTTDVLQEGEDLHTFCKRVIHYGITWTPSAMEQRTGRVDRIGSLAQRNLDGRSQQASPDELIQVYYPHLADTVERLQVRRVMQRLNRFLEMVHTSESTDNGSSSRIDVARAILKDAVPPPPLDRILESAYPVRDAWLEGEMSDDDVDRPDIAPLDARFDEVCNHVVETLGVEAIDSASSPRRFVGTAHIQGQELIRAGADNTVSDIRRQRFELTMRSQAAGDATLLRCRSLIGYADLSDRAVLDQFYNAQFDVGIARLCARRGNWQYHEMAIELDRLFHLDATQPEEVSDLVRIVVLQADAIEETIFAHDKV